MTFVGRFVARVTAAAVALAGAAVWWDLNQFLGGVS